jgi:uncharacterized protein (TIGR01244 family)
MQPVALNDAIAVGDFPSSEEIAILAKAGFKSLLNSQPDGEVERLMSAAGTADAAIGHGLAYHFLPLESRRPSESQIQAFARAVAALPKPVYAFCYSGSRSAAAWALAQAAFMEAGEIVAACAAAGYDISFMAPQLAERRARRPAVQAAAAAAMAAEAMMEQQAAGSRQQLESPALRPPQLMPRIVLPRAASSEGFAT